MPSTSEKNDPRRLIHETTDVTSLVAVGVNATGAQLTGAAAWPPVRVDSDTFPVPSARTSPAARAIEERAVEHVLTSADGWCV
jgi:hypothetical protein